MALVRYIPKSTFASWPELNLVSNRLSRVFGDVWDTLYRFRFPGQVGGLIMPPSG